MTQRKVTLFRNIKETSNGFYRDVMFALERIKKGNSKDLIVAIRKEPDSSKRNKLKAQLPSVCFSGEFESRRISGLKKHSGLLILDFDNLEKPEKFRDSLKKDEFIFSAWISPSGDGVKALVKIPAEAENHKLYFQSFQKRYPDIDNSGSDVSRVCFESFDPSIWINQKSKTWDKKDGINLEDVGASTEKVKVKLTSSNQIIDRLFKWWNNKYKFGEGSRNVSLFTLASAFNRFGISEGDANYHCSQFAEKGFDEIEISKLVKSAYKNISEHGTQSFEDTEIVNKITSLVRSGKTDTQIQKEFPDIPKDEIRKSIECTRGAIDIDDFWYYNDKGKIKLSIHKFKLWLEENNFRKFYPSEDSDTFIFIKKENCFFDEIGEMQIKDFVLNKIYDRRAEIGFSPYDFMAGNTSFFRWEFLSFLDNENLSIKKDTKDTAYLYYQNCYLEITKDGVVENDYFDQKDMIWRNQVINRDFKKVDFEKSEYKRFIELISGEDEDKYKAFVSTIGYLLHSFKTSANNKAVILNDETISDNPNGGSGKGIFWNALRYIKKVANIDGKTFDFNKSFPYQTVSQDSQILIFDDVRKKFNFESLFSLITEGITLEYKNQTAVQIPVEDSPKILITTNYTIGGDGGSFVRRKHELELSSYFNYQHTPEMEFGKMLFSDWDEKEWLKFDNFMIHCLRFYLENGLLKDDIKNLELKKLYNKTSEDFVNFFDGHLQIYFDKEFDKQETYDLFKETYPDWHKLTRNKFTIWMKQYCVSKKLFFSERIYTGNKFLVTISKELEDEPF